MRLIAFTYPGFSSAEAALLNEILPSVDGLHMRKEADSSRWDWKALMDGLSPEFHSKVWLHDHYELASSYKLGGIHLTGTFMARYGCGLPKQIGAWKRKGLGLSVTCHTLVELDSLPTWSDRVFIAPVFDSISKPGYISAWDLENWHVPKGLSSEIIALGGVDTLHIPLLRQKGFDGLAVLGALWNHPDPLNKIGQLKRKCEEAALTY